MGLPLPRVIPDVGPGGGLVTALGGINSLANENVLRQMNQIKKKYLPSTLSAEAASKLAYANLMGPQFLAKLLANEGAVANMGDAAARQALQKSVSAGMGQAGIPNALAQMQGQGNPSFSGIGQPSTNSWSGKLKNALGKFLGFDQNQSPNPMQSQNMPQPMQQAPQQSPNARLGSQNQNPSDQGEGDAMVDMYKRWMASPEGQRELAKGESANIPDAQGIAEWDAIQKTIQNGGMPLTVTKPVQSGSPEWATAAGRFKGTQEQGKESGKFRAQALKDIGQTELALSGSGAAQDEMIKIIQNPVWQQAREKIPAFQKQQLSVLKVTGSPELKKLAGEFTSAGQAIIASQVAGMGNKHLVREYDLAEKQKINDSDTIESAEGKLTNAKNLHDIAEKKYHIIKDLLKQGVDEADAVDIANKKVDVSAIRRATDKLLERKISVTNKKTGETKLMTIKEAQELGVPNV